MTFSDFTKAMVVRVADRDVATIPYDKIEKLSYEYSEKHRITQGAIVMVASLGVGAMVMLTNSEGHWLYIDYHQDSGASTWELGSKMCDQSFPSFRTGSSAVSGGGAGGGGGGNSNSNLGTPAGDYTIVVTGSVGPGSSADSHSINLTLTVS